MGCTVVHASDTGRLPGQASGVATVAPQAGNQAAAAPFESLPEDAGVLVELGRRRQVTPFESLRVVDDGSGVPRILVRVPHVETFDGVEGYRRGEEVSLVSLNGADVRALFEASRRYIVESGRQSTIEEHAKRLGEELADVMATLARMQERVGRPVTPYGARVTLELRNGAGELFTLTGVEATFEHRLAIVHSRQERPDRASELDPDHLSPDQMVRIVEMLGDQISRRSSYVGRPEADGTRFDLDASVEKVVEAIRSGAIDDRRSFTFALSEIVHSLGDGHAGLGGGFLREVFRPGVAPGLFVPADGRIALVRADRTGAIDDEYPYVESIEGLPIEVWIEAASAPRYVNQASESLRRRGALRMMRFMGEVGEALGVTVDGPLRFTLVDAAGVRRPEPFVFDPLDRANGFPIFGRWPRPRGYDETRDGPITRWAMHGDIAFLQIGKMGGVNPDRALRAKEELEQVEAIHAFMISNDLRGSSGLVIDLRGNSGGTRAVLEALYPYLHGDAPPRVANVALVRESGLENRREIDASMAARRLHPRDATHWSDAERRAIERAMEGLDVGWIPDGPVTDWYVLVMSGEGVDDHYTRPVVILVDQDTFSAADVTTAVLRPLGLVTVMGQTTGGGSGRSTEVRLPGGFRVRLSTMASYFEVEAGGGYRTLDGGGVTPSMLVEPNLEFYLFETPGARDASLDAALEFIRRQRDR